MKLHLGLINNGICDLWINLKSDQPTHLLNRIRAYSVRSSCRYLGLTSNGQFSNGPAHRLAARWLMVENWAVAVKA